MPFLFINYTSIKREEKISWFKATFLSKYFQWLLISKWKPTPFRHDIASYYFSPHCFILPLSHCTLSYIDLLAISLTSQTPSYINALTRIVLFCLEIYFPWFLVSLYCHYIESDIWSNDTYQSFPNHCITKSCHIHFVFIEEKKKRKKNLKVYKVKKYKSTVNRYRIILQGMPCV